MSVDLGHLPWRKLDQSNVNIATIPNSRQNQAHFTEAKQKELQKLKDFDTYNSVENTNFPIISTQWVLTEGDNGTKWLGDLKKNF